MKQQRKMQKRWAVGGHPASVGRVLRLPSSPERSGPPGLLTVKAGNAINTSVCARAKEEKKEANISQNLAMLMLHGEQTAFP